MYSTVLQYTRYSRIPNANMQMCLCKSVQMWYTKCAFRHQAPFLHPPSAHPRLLLNQKRSQEEEKEEGTNNWGRKKERRGRLLFLRATSLPITISGT